MGSFLKMTNFTNMDIQKKITELEIEVSTLTEEITERKAQIKERNRQIGKLKTILTHAKSVLEGDGFENVFAITADGLTKES